MAKNSARRQAALDSIANLERERKRDILKCVISLVAIIVLIFGKTLLQLAGFAGASSPFAEGLLMMGSLGLCIFAGTASINATKRRNTINTIMEKNSLTKEKVRSLREDSR